MMSFAASPGTEVEPMWSMRNASSRRFARTGCASVWKLLGPPRRSGNDLDGLHSFSLQVISVSGLSVVKEAHAEVLAAGEPLGQRLTFCPTRGGRVGGGVPPSRLVRSPAPPRRTGHARLLRI